MLRWEATAETMGRGLSQEGPIGSRSVAGSWNDIVCFYGQYLEDSKCQRATWALATGTGITLPSNLPVTAGGCWAGMLHEENHCLLVDTPEVAAPFADQHQGHRAEKSPSIKSLLFEIVSVRLERARTACGIWALGHLQRRSGLIVQCFADLLLRGFIMQ